MFEAATNREEYYKLLAQKIYHIRKELEDRKNQKKPNCSTKGTGLLLRIYCSIYVPLNVYCMLYVCIIVHSCVVPTFVH